jgi:hypothetical protein
MCAGVYVGEREWESVCERERERGREAWREAWREGGMERETEIETGRDEGERRERGGRENASPTAFQTRRRS